MESLFRRPEKQLVPDGRVIGAQSCFYEPGNRPQRSADFHAYLPAPE